MTRAGWISLLLLPGGCSLMSSAAPMVSQGSSEWYEITPVTRSPADINRTVRDAMVRQGHAVSAFDPAAASLVSDWSVHLSPRWREGFRTCLESQTVPAGAGAFTVRVRSWREINDNGKNPGDPDGAVWIGAGLDSKHASLTPAPAQRLHQILKLRFLGMTHD